LEVSFNWAELLGLDSIQESTILLEDSVFWRSNSWHFGLRLQERVLLALIYHFTEFGAIWRLPSARPKYWSFTSIHEGVSSAKGGLDLTLVLLVLVFSLYSTFGGLYILILSIL
jgi:hypothetical protein